MITLYFKASDGSFCKLELITWDHVNYALILLCWRMGEQNLTFEEIPKVAFDVLDAGPWFSKYKFSLTPKGEQGVVGFCTEYKIVYADKRDKTALVKNNIWKSSS